MVLVDYPDSDSDSDEIDKDTSDQGPSTDTLIDKHTTTSTKPTPSSTTQRPPPPNLPSTFTTLYASNTRSSTTDDPALHRGRQRQIPHIAGNWPSFIYLEWLPSDLDLGKLDAIINRVSSRQRNTPASTSTSASSHANDRIQGEEDKTALHSSLRSDLGVRQPLHISLSAPLILKTDTKDAFSRDLQKALQSSQVVPFQVTPAQVKWVHNFDRTRYFLIVTLQRSEDDELLRLLRRCNDVVADYEMPQLYAAGTGTGVGISGHRSGSGAVVSLDVSDAGSPDFETHDKFHISIAWTLCEPVNLHDVQSDILGGVENLDIHFNDVLLKIGNQITAIPLAGLT